MKWPASVFVGSLPWACPLGEIFALTLIPLTTAWSVGRWDTAPFRLVWRGPIARSRRPTRSDPAGGRTRLPAVSTPRHV